MLSNVPRWTALVPKSARLLHSSTVLSAGHSKWQNIRHDKAKNDAKKSKEAYSMANRITTSVKQGGVDGNAQLATLMEKAKKLNITKKIIEAAVKRGTGEISNEGAQLSDVTYEFMGPGGVAIIVEASTDNKNRTVGLVKHAMSKINASMSPCQYMFQRKGEVVFLPASADQLLDSAFELAIEVGAEDVEEFEDVDGDYDGGRLFRMITEPAELHSISNSVSKEGYTLKDSKTTFIADADCEVDFPEEHEKAMKKCIELLDEVEEVSNYYTNIRAE